MVLGAVKLVSHVHKRHGVFLDHAIVRKPFAYLYFVRVSWLPEIGIVV